MWFGGFFFIMGAVVLVIAYRFFRTHQRTIMMPEGPMQQGIPANDEWRLKYYDAMEKMEQQAIAMQQERESMAQELEEAQVATEELQLELMRKEQAFRRKQEEPEDYLGHLQKAQRNFEQHKQQIQVLLDQLRDQKETELRLIESNRAHEQAEQQLQEFQALLIQKEQEVQLLRHQLQLAEEKNSRLAAAQSEFEQLNQELQQISEQHQKLNNQLLRIKEIDAILTQLTQKGE